MAEKSIDEARIEHTGRLSFGKTLFEDTTMTGHRVDANPGHEVSLPYN